MTSVQQAEVPPAEGTVSQKVLGYDYNINYKRNWCPAHIKKAMHFFEKLSKWCIRMSIYLDQ